MRCEAPAAGLPLPFIVNSIMGARRLTIWNLFNNIEIPTDWTEQAESQTTT